MSMQNKTVRKRAKTPEEKEKKRIERILRNRRAAQESRERKKLYLQHVERKLQLLEQLLFRGSVDVEQAFGDQHSLSVLEEYRRLCGDATLGGSASSSVLANSVSSFDSSLDTLINSNGGVATGTAATSTATTPIDSVVIKASDESLVPSSQTYEFNRFDAEPPIVVKQEQEQYVTGLMSESHMVTDDWIWPWDQTAALLSPASSASSFLGAGTELYHDSPLTL
ncbi:hypothetical protein Kpol_1058p19 [Vanderwaltozyma polyspora DSM 70294]|uniref:BZIP domain-containing protein n=1 Tax=Vanderwaltozyma polyspora (strain ATCC 22028 / DSM 70294 / BCRC 21397 / CBS 2163 / NBRC 10782 / NRRL Y-8283 / UCD 57-17) TaxID=436907 RepID=A7TJQ3_VANPO|nr:uncharacterized protein Kpol_1058p19 [Vanderwaltozyma polyspora DSM 70294]EDO17482.1 hypothetical protein Kpol_1058p19 [Vanderwaltozyma polyspora DSM 70294]